MEEGQCVAFAPYKPPSDRDVTFQLQREVDVDCLKHAVEGMHAQLQLERSPSSAERVMRTAADVHALINDADASLEPLI